MMRRLLLAISPGEIWAALIEDDRPMALRLARTLGDAMRGDLYLGRVVGSRPELQALLVDIGEERPGFLGGAALQPREGEAVVVKVTKPARADKAAALTQKLKPDEVRFAAVPVAASPPLLLYRRETALGLLLRDLTAQAPDEVVLDDAAAAVELRSWLKRNRADFAGKIILHTAEIPLFEVFGVAAAVETALAPRVALPAGGAITIEPTAAAILIDVDGGDTAALAANLAAAEEIARQIRWRDLSGPMVIDFIGMDRREHRSRISTALAAALAADEVQFLGWTRLGHFELVRRRHHPSLTEMLYEHRPDAAAMKTALTVALEALRQLQTESRHTPGKRFTLRVHPEVAACFDAVGRGARRTLETRLGYTVKIIAEPRPRDSVTIAPA